MFAVKGLLSPGIWRSNAPTKMYWRFKEVAGDPYREILATYQPNISRCPVARLAFIMLTTAFRYGCSEQKWSGDAHHHNEKRITIAASATDLFHSIFQRDLQASPQIRPLQYDGSFMIKTPKNSGANLGRGGKIGLWKNSRASNAEDY